MLRRLRRTLHFGVALLLGISLIGCDSGGSGDDESSNPVMPNAPSNLAATSGTDQIVLDWQSVSEAESYTVYRSTSSGSASSGSPVGTDLTDTEYTDTDVSNGVTYYYQVTAVADEESAPSNEVDVTPFTEPPSRP